MQPALAQGTVQGRNQAQSSLWGSGKSRCPRPAVAGAGAEGARTPGQQARLPLPCTLTAEYLGVQQTHVRPVGPCSSSGLDMN